MKQKFGIVTVISLLVIWIGLEFYHAPIVKGVWDSPVIEFVWDLAFNYLIFWAAWTALDHAAGK